MKFAKVKGIYTTEMDNLEEHIPEDPDKFCVFVRVMAGPRDEEGQESFDLKVCNPAGLEEQIRRDGFALGMHSLFVAEYDPALIKRVLTKFFEKHSGESWAEIASKLSHIGHWEFQE